MEHVLTVLGHGHKTTMQKWRLFFPAPLNCLYFEASNAGGANKVTALIICGYNVKNAPVRTGVVILALSYCGVTDYCTQIYFMIEHKDSKMLSRIKTMGIGGEWIYILLSFPSK